MRRGHYTYTRSYRIVYNVLSLSKKYFIQYDKGGQNMKQWKSIQFFFVFFLILNKYPKLGPSVFFEVSANVNYRLHQTSNKAKNKN